jgi:hypothetical protein
MFEFETENEYDVLIHTRLQTRSCSVALLCLSLKQKTSMMF